MSRRRLSAAPRRARGFALVEVMVAVTVGLVLLAAVLQILASNKQAYSVQDGSSQLNDNIRFATHEIGANLRMADHWGGIEATEVSAVAGLPAIANDCGAGWAAASAGLSGFDGGASSPLPICIPNADHVPGSDVVVVRYADGRPLPSTDPGGGAPWVGDATNQQRLFVRSAIGRRGVIFRGDNIAALPADVYEAADPDPAGFFNYPLKVVVYFVRPCSGPGANGVCDAGDDGGTPVPTLTRLTLDGATMVQEDLATGVEQMQLLYGLDVDADGNADRFQKAGAIGVTQWLRVVSVRIDLLVRNPAVDTSFDDSGTVYAMAGGDSYTVPAADRNFARRLVTTVVQLRNRVRSG